MRCYYKNLARDGSGNIIGSASVTVFLAGTSTPASIYTSLTSATAVNAVTTSDDGTFEFYVDRFDYNSSQKFKLTIAKSGYTSITIDDIDITSVVLGTYAISANKTVSTSIDLPDGVEYTIATGKTLAFTGEFNASRSKHFTCAGTGKVTLPNATKATPVWWGGDITGVVDSATAINYAESSGAKYIDMHGSWGISSPIFLTQQGVVFDGVSRVLSQIYPLANDIHTGAYPNAMIVNTVNAFNGTIKSLRLTNSLAYTGWVISAYEGGSGGVEKALFSANLYDLWVDTGTSASGFFQGGLYDSWVHHVQFENMKTRFYHDGTAGNAMSGTVISNITEGTVVGDFITAVNSGRNIISNIHSYGLDNDSYLINLKTSSDFDISNVNVYGITTNGAASLLKLDTCTNIRMDNYSMKYISGANEIGGLYLKASELRATNGYIYGAKGAGYYPIYITGIGNDINIFGLTVDGSNNYQIVTEDAGGQLTIDGSSRFVNSAGSILSALGTDTINITLQNSSFLNNDAESMFIYASSGRVKIVNNDIGLDNATPTGTYLFYFTGSGQLIIGNNNIVGSGDTGEYHPSHSQTITFSAPNVGGTSYRSGAGDPTAAVTPLFLQETYLNTTGNHFYLSYGLANTDWSALS